MCVPGQFCYVSSGSGSCFAAAVDPTSPCQSNDGTVPEGLPCTCSGGATSAVCEVGQACVADASSSQCFDTCTNLFGSGGVCLTNSFPQEPLDPLPAATLCSGGTGSCTRTDCCQQPTCTQFVSWGYATACTVLGVGFVPPPGDPFCSSVGPNGEINLQGCAHTCCTCAGFDSVTACTQGGAKQAPETIICTAPGPCTAADCCEVRCSQQGPACNVSAAGDPVCGGFSAAGELQSDGCTAATCCDNTPQFCGAAAVCDGNFVKDDSQDSEQCGTNNNPGGCTNGVCCVEAPTTSSTTSTTSSTTPTTSSTMPTSSTTSTGSTAPDSSTAPLSSTTLASSTCEDYECKGRRVVPDPSKKQVVCPPSGCDSETCCKWRRRLRRRRYHGSKWDAEEPKGR